MTTFFIILYIILTIICARFLPETPFLDETVVWWILGSTITLFILSLFLPIELPVNYKTDTLGTKYIADIILFATPSIIIFGLIGIIDTIRIHIKNKRDH